MAGVNGVNGSWQLTLSRQPSLTHPVKLAYAEKPHTYVVAFDSPRFDYVFADEPQLLTCRAYCQIITKPGVQAKGDAVDVNT